MKKVFGLFMALVLMTSVIAGCASTASSTEVPAATEAATVAATEAATTAAGATEAAATEAAPVVAHKVVVAIGADPADLSPYAGMSMGGIAVIKSLYEYLFEVDSMGGEAKPLIAKSVQKVDDTTYDVTIFDYVTDSAGNKITASDVAWSYNTAMATGNYHPLGSIDSVTATGDYTVEFKMKSALAFGDLEKIMTEAPIVSEKAYNDSPDKMATDPVSTSAYVVKEYVPGSSLTLEARADYWQTDPQYRTLFSQANVKTVVYQIITEPAQNAIALQTGTADISASVTSDDIAQFEEGGAYADQFTVFKFLDNLTQVLTFNGSEKPFQSKELRQAIAYAIDTKAMCEAVAPGSCAPSHTIGNANFGGYQTAWDSEPYYEFDLAKAKDLFAQSGYKAGDLTFKMLIQSDSKAALMAQIIASNLAELGITVNIDQEETAVYNQNVLDSSAWDMVINSAAGGDYAVSPWMLTYAAEMNNGTTSGFVTDDKLQSLLSTAASIDGFTPDNLTAFNEYQKDMVYSYGLLSFMNNVVSVKRITNIVRDTRGQIIPGACTYTN